MKMQQKMGPQPCSRSGDSSWPAVARTAAACSGCYLLMQNVWLCPLSPFIPLLLFLWLCCPETAAPSSRDTSGMKDIFIWEWCLSPFLGTLLLQAALNAEVVPMMWVMRIPMLSCLFFPVSSLTPIWYFRPPVIISFCLFPVSLPSSHTGFLPWWC